MSDLFCGIDVAKTHLDVALRHTGKTQDTWRVTNDDAGIHSLLDKLTPLAPTLIVLEATGGYQMLAVATLTAAGLAVAVINPRQAREFAKATASWPRPTSSMPLCWPISPRPFGRPSAPPRCPAAAFRRTARPSPPTRRDALRRTQSLRLCSARLAPTHPETPRLAAGRPRHPRRRVVPPRSRLPRLARQG